MPYYRCASCGIAAYSGAGYSSAPACPACGANLTPELRLFLHTHGGCQFSRHLVREPQAAGAARQELGRLQGELLARELEIASLLTTELITNSVRHAGPGAGRMLAFEVRATETVVRVTVSDGGDGFVPHDRLNGQPAHDGGWGLHLVDKLADRWGAETGQGTSVWFELDRESAPEPAA
jgi:anti-sigma regulatory factor (Ser/Thr protein kinase)